MAGDPGDEERLAVNGLVIVIESARTTWLSVADGRVEMIEPPDCPDDTSSEIVWAPGVNLPSRGGPASHRAAHPHASSPVVAGSAEAGPATSPDGPLRA